MMKKKHWIILELTSVVIILAVLVAVMVPKFLGAQKNINTPYHIPDKNFRIAMAEYMEVSENGYYTKEEARNTSKIKLGLDISNRGIKSLEGIHYFRDISNLNCSNNKLTQVNLHNMYGLLTLIASNNQITEITLPQSYNYLADIKLDHNRLTSIELSNFPRLYSLDLSNNQLTSIDLSNNQKLNDLNLTYNKFQNIDISKNTALKTIFLHDNNLKTLNTDALNDLSMLIVHNNQITSIDLRNNPELIFVVLSNNPLENVIFPETIQYKALVLSDTKINLTQYDIDQLSNIEAIFYTGNPIKRSDLPFFHELEKRIGEFQVIQGIASRGLSYSATMVIDTTQQN